MRKGLFLILLFINVVAFAETFNVSNVSEFRQALENVSLNGENDVIILDKGIYKTTEDGLGSFKYDDQEEANITIKAKEGLVREDVILDGNGTNTVLYFQNESDSTFTLEGVSVVNGKRGLYFNKNLIVDDCNFTNNSANGSGGAIFADSNLTVTNSTFTNNSANDNGGAIYARSTSTVTNSAFTNNSANGSGGAIFADSNLTVTNSAFTNNSTSDYYGGGGAIYARSNLTVTNSAFTNNSDNRKGGKGGAIYSYPTIYSYSTTTVTNSIFTNNSAKDGGAIYVRYNSIITNSTFTNNSANDNGCAIYAVSTSTITNSTFFNNQGNNILYGRGSFINNIFNENNGSQIYFRGDSKVYNNYIDYLKLENEEPYTIIKKNNIQPNGENVNFIDNNLRVDSSSISIDKGLNPESENFKSIIDEFVSSEETKEFIYETLQSDKDGNSRVTNGIIDLGAYEYGATKTTDTAPIIENIKYTAPNKVFTDIYFDFNISVSSGREVANIYVDFGDGIFTEVDSINVKYQFTTAKDYEIKIKVIDSEGEETIKSFPITISDLTTNEAIEYGKNICKENPNECGINSTYQTSNSNLDSLANHLSNLPIGWNLVGTSEALNDYSIFDNIDTIWAFKNNKWTWQDPKLPTRINIESFDGFWIKK